MMPMAPVSGMFRSCTISDGTPQMDDVDKLLGEGRHAEAAARARAAGELSRAAGIYERIWDFRAAAECAREAGDLRAALRNLLDARAVDEAQAVAADMEPRDAAEILENRRAYDLAGALWEKA